MTTLSTILAWKTPWTEEPDRMQSYRVRHNGSDLAQQTVTEELGSKGLESVGQGVRPGTSEAEIQDGPNLLELTPNKDALFIIGDWNPKVGSQEILK